MRLLLLLAAMALCACPAVAYDLGTTAPAKPDVPATYAPPPRGPETPFDRQVLPIPAVGAWTSILDGDTIANAFTATIPGYYTGTTIGYNNDYDEVCPYTGSTAPDVVYRLEPSTTIMVDIDFCYSSYDTKVYMYDQNLNLVACNDDFYFSAPCYTYSSKLESVLLQGGGVYYVVIDGYGAAEGAYVMEIGEFTPCVIDPPWWYQPEGEPPLVNGYLDAYNGGCNSPEFGNPFQDIYSPLFAGVSGWYSGPTGVETRDTDWFRIQIPAGGYLEITGDAEHPTYMFELGPQNCDSVGVIQNVIIGPCLENTMFIVGPSGSYVWFWVGPTTFVGPPGIHEYNYVLILGYYVETERHSWTDVKSLFR